MHTERRYEQLYSKLLTYAEELHQSNKRRIRRGIIWLLLLPLFLGAILLVTGASKIVFLIIWILCMFALCAYLIVVEYVDDSIQKAINDVSETEAQFDTLVPQPEPIPELLGARLEPIRERISERIAAMAETAVTLENQLIGNVPGAADADTREDAPSDDAPNADAADANSTVCSGKEANDA